MIISDHSLEAKPVRVVNADHQRTILVSIARAPNRSARNPLGISNRA
jgi:hypothetical protein